MFRVGRWFSATLLSGLIAYVPAFAADVTVSLVPVKDASIFNDGTPTSQTMADGASFNIWTSATLSGIVRRAMLQFDLSSVPAGAVVKQVTLTVFELRTHSSDAVELHKLTSSWSEGPANPGTAGNGVPASLGDSTWLHRNYPNLLWSAPGGDFAPTASAVQLVGGANASYAWSGTGAASGLVQDVQGWVDQPLNNFGWMMIGNEDVTQGAKRFAARNFSIVDRRPTLTVVYTPPAAPVGSDGDVPLPAWALGLVGLACARTLWRSRGSS